MNTCKIPDCDSKTKARGLCSRHYQLFRWRGTIDQVSPRAATECVVCGKPLPSSHFARMYCSDRCSDRARYGRVIANRIRETPCCLQCGVDLAGKRPQARFCSVACGQNYRNDRLARERLAVKPPRNCRWCGEPIAQSLKRSRVYCGTRCKSLGRRAEKYGLEQSALALLLAQHGGCAICGSSAWGTKGPQVDHSHSTGTVRGVLCINCNNGLGRFHDDPARLRAAADYLERFT